MTSELISERHRARRAVIYIRQSSPHQVLTNQESLRLQYDLRRRARALGWREEDVKVIDSDLGLSGAATEVHGPPIVTCARQQPPGLPSADHAPLRRNRVAALPSAAGSGEGPPERKAWPPPGSGRSGLP